jgi:hypothetical protein
MPKITYLDYPRESQMLDYAANIYKEGKFVICVRYEGYSGTAAHDEIKDLRTEYPAQQGYRIEW